MTDLSPLSELISPPFATRHIGPADADQTRMLAAVGFASIADLIAVAVPEAIRATDRLEPAPGGERDRGHRRAARPRRAQQVLTSMIGLGYHGTITPGVIRRNVLENPAWYTAYTPYQPEISQGRLEALLNFQTMVTDLTGLRRRQRLAARRGHRRRRGDDPGPPRRPSASRDVFVVDADTLPQTIAVLRTRAEPLGIELVEGDFTGELPRVLRRARAVPGRQRRGSATSAPIADAAHARGALVVAAADLLALTLLAAPGELGADIAIGSAQRFGVPLGFGGPHAGLHGRPRRPAARRCPAASSGSPRTPTAPRLPARAADPRAAHPPGEGDHQHLHRAGAARRDRRHVRRLPRARRACAAIAPAHPPARRRARRRACATGGVEVVHDTFFDTVLAARARPGGRGRRRGPRARGQPAPGRRRPRRASPSTRRPTLVHLEQVLAAFGVDGAVLADLDAATHDALPAALARDSDYLTHPVFHSHHSETAMLRYLRRLQDRDLALDRSMIPLGSCTMKLNATTEMEPITWPEFAGLHPFAPTTRPRATSS